MSGQAGQGTPAGRRRLVLLGAGHAQVQVLQGLAHRRPADLDITVIAPSARQLYSGMVPGFVAGHYALEQCAIPLQGLLARCGARHLPTHAVALDAGARTVTLATGQTVAYDWLSLNTGPEMNPGRIEAQMPGALAHALWVRPMEVFVQRWPDVATLARQRPLHIAVVGAGAAGLELAMAAAHALAAPAAVPGSRVSLIAGRQPPGAGYPPGARRRIARALQRLRIDVVQQACAGMAPGTVQFTDGGRLACDVPLLAVGAQAPQWLAGSGLARDAAGFVAVNAFQQSTSHPAVFAAGDVASRADSPHARSGVYAVRAGPPLLANLRAALQGEPLAAYAPQRRTLNLLSCGGRHAIAVWGGFSVEGGWVWRWKDHIDRRFVATYAK